MGWLWELSRSWGPLPDSRHGVSNVAPSHRVRLWKRTLYKFHTNLILRTRGTLAKRDPGGLILAMDHLVVFS